MFPLGRNSVPGKGLFSLTTGVNDGRPQGPLYDVWPHSRRSSQYSLQKHSWEVSHMLPMLLTMSQGLSCLSREFSSGRSLCHQSSTLLESVLSKTLLSTASPLLFRVRRWVPWSSHKSLTWPNALRLWLWAPPQAPLLPPHSLAILNFCNFFRFLYLLLPSVFRHIAPSTWNTFM